MIAGRGTGQPGAAGGLARHVPVMLREVLSRLNPKDGALYIDWFRSAYQDGISTSQLSTRVRLDA